MAKNDRDYDIKDIEIDERFVLAKRDMLIAFLVVISYTLVMIGAAYIFGKGDPRNYKYVLGMPFWWFVNLAITAVYLVIIYILTHKVYEAVDVSAYLHEEEREVE